MYSTRGRVLQWKPVGEDFRGVDAQEELGDLGACIGETYQGEYNVVRLQLLRDWLIDWIPWEISSQLSGNLPPGVDPAILERRWLRLFPHCQFSGVYMPLDASRYVVAVVAAQFDPVTGGYSNFYFTHFSDLLMPDLEQVYQESWIWDVTTGLDTHRRLVFSRVDTITSSHYDSRIVHLDQFMGCLENIHVWVQCCVTCTSAKPDEQYNEVAEYGFLLAPSYWFAWRKGHPTLSNVVDVFDPSGKPVGPVPPEEDQ